MNSITTLDRLREMVTARSRRERRLATTGIVAIAVLLAAISLIAAQLSDVVTNNIAALLSLDLIIIAIVSMLLVSRTRTALTTAHLDSRDMSKLFDSDHPIAADALLKTKERGYYTYADLDNELSGYERIQAALEYGETGINRKFKVSQSKAHKANTKPLRASKALMVSTGILVLSILQIGVILGLLPTISELITGEQIPSFTLHMSLKAITYEILFPKLSTVAALQAIKFFIRRS